MINFILCFMPNHGQLQPAGVVSTGIGKGIDRFLSRTTAPVIDQWSTVGIRNANSNDVGIYLNMNNNKIRRQTY